MGGRVSSDHFCRHAEKFGYTTDLFYSHLSLFIALNAVSRTVVLFSWLNLDIFFPSSALCAPWFSGKLSWVSKHDYAWTFNASKVSSIRKFYWPICSISASALVIIRNSGEGVRTNVIQLVWFAKSKCFIFSKISKSDNFFHDGPMWSQSYM
jgi:hypothetical protein